VGSDTPDHPLLAFLVSTEFRSLHKDSDRYLATLSWVAAQHPTEFREYILSLTRGRRHLSLSREDILAQSRHNQAREIPSTPYWAIMNIDTATKRRFLTRVLDFCGYEEDVIEQACSAIGMRRPTRRFSLFS
jgi:negative modulator of initiation of replication